MTSPRGRVSETGATRSRRAGYVRNWRRIGSALLTGLGLVPLLMLLLANEAPSQAVQLPGGRFAFSYPTFSGAPGALTAQQYAQYFAGAMTNPNVFRIWIPLGSDIRLLNPGGVYLKHLNLRTIDRTELEPSVQGRPDYMWIRQNHPEWIVRDVNGNPIPLFAPSEEILDFGNDAYLDWVLNTWMPNHFFDSTDRDPNGVYWYLHDEGSFTGMALNCAAADPICNKYRTAQGVQDAWIHMLDRFKAKYPNRNIVINTGPTTYQSVSTQMASFKNVLSHAAGYFGESLTSDHVYWSTEPNSGKRTALITTLQLASWLADNNKIFFPNLGVADGAEPTQAATDYAWAFFNLMRKGDWQFFSKVTKNWQPEKYPEMDRPLGQPLEVAVEFSPGVYRRAFQHAIAYVNISDNSIAINLPTDSTYQNSLGQLVNSPLTLRSFSGLTVYKSSTVTPTPPPTPTNLTVRPG
jgi:hypothetical protein